MNHEDDEVLETVGGYFTGVNPTTPLESVTARGRRLRDNRRKLTGAATMGIAAVAALAVALPGGSARPTTVQAAPVKPTVNVQLVGWSMVGNANGTVTLTFREFSDLDLLRQTLAQAGIRADVVATEPATCGAAAPGVHELPNNGVVAFTFTGGQGADGATETVDPAAMPAGSVLRIGGVPQTDVRAALRSADGTVTPLPVAALEFDLFSGQPGPDQCVRKPVTQFLPGDAGQK